MTFFSSYIAMKIIVRSVVTCKKSYCKKIIVVYRVFLYTGARGTTNHYSTIMSNGGVDADLSPEWRPPRRTMTVPLLHSHTPTSMRLHPSSLSRDKHLDNTSSQTQPTYMESSCRCTQSSSSTTQLPVPSLCG